MSKTVFFAEDDVDDCSFVEHALKEVAPEYKVLTAQDGVQAIQLLDTLPDQDMPELIILDYNMPQMDGLETLRFLEDNDRYRTIPKIMYSNGSYKGYIDSCMYYGAKAFITKGQTLEQIKKDVKQMLSYCG
jgi:CheY-like chemotaxis protein